ncbi:MAG: CehA/McbA family metallohydrolase [Deltaproteobacteria bacterium]|nr:CehA/McbA family metallohydrolase [Deltaproteobacteria bacterium]
MRRGIAVWQSRILGRARGPAGQAVQPGDFVMESPSLRVIVAGEDRERRAGPAGALLDLGSRREGFDSVRRVVPFLRSGARRIDLVLEDIEVADARDGRPAVRASFNGRGLDDGVRVVREISFVGDGRVVAITTFVRAPTSSRLQRVMAGATITWGGATPFAPGPGFLGDDATHEVPWVGREGATRSALFSARPAPLSVRSSFERRATSSVEDGALVSDTEVMTKPVDLAAGRATSIEQLVVMANGGLEAPLAELLRARPRPVGHVRALVPFDRPGATVTAIRAGGTVALRARVVGNRAVLPLEPGRYELTAVAPGHAASDTAHVELSARSTRDVSLPIPEGGRIRIRARDVTTDAPLLARARVLAIPPTPPLDLGPRWRADGAIDTVILRNGEAEVRVPPGSYRVVVTRGPEWTMRSAAVDVTASFRPDVLAELAQVVDAGSWVPCELHVHQAPSADSEVPLADRVAALAAEGIRFAIPTDHNVVTDLRDAARALRPHAHLGTVPGVEVTTEGRVYGHFNVFPMTPDPELPGFGAPPWVDLSPTELFAGARAGDPARIIQVNHPRFDDGIGYFSIMGARADGSSASPDFDPTFDAIEIWNGYDLATPGEPEATLQHWYGLLGLGRRYVATGSSDSHHVTYTWAGYPRTYVYVEGAERDEVPDADRLLASLRAGRAFVTSGPFLDVTVGGVRPGEIARPTGSRVRVRASVQAPTWMDVSRVEIIRDGDVVRVLPLRAPRGRRADRVTRLEVSADISVEHDTWIVVVARGERPMDDVLVRPVLPVAFTNPVAIDADGDGLTMFSDWDEERVRWTELPGEGDAGVAPDDAGPEAGVADASGDSARD